MKTYYKKTLLSTLVTSAIAASVNVKAEDTEVFYSENVSKPNVMFVLDISGSMNNTVPDSGGKSRITIMQEAFAGVLADAPDNVKIGIMNYGEISSRWNGTQDERYRQHSTSGVAFPATDVNALVKPITDVSGTGNLLAPTEDETIREYLPRVVNTWRARSWTPIVSALYEAALYFRGEEMHYGLTSPATSGAHPAAYSGSEITVAVEDVGRHNIRTTTTNELGATVPQYQYESPIESSCQDNYIILMTDGGPTYVRSNASSNRVYTTSPFYRVMRGDSSYSSLAGGITDCVIPPGNKWIGRCGPEITSYIATHDNIPSKSDLVPNGQDGDQLVKTYVVGFGRGLSNSAKLYLKSLETIDDNPDTEEVEDGYYEADKPEELIEAFSKILREITEPKGTLASPGYSVNVKNGLEHEKDIYIPVFDRKNASRWSGNLKKFALVDVGGKRLIRGKNGADAVDELGGFTSEALDYWSDSADTDPDGARVESGGVASLLSDPDERHIFSNLTGDSNVALSSAANALHINNIGNINNTTLGLSSGSVAYRKKLIQFMRGWAKGEYSANANPKGEARKHMGDMLHSEPLVVTYSDADAVNKQQYIFAATNEGYLHAFDTTTGEEKFAFIPAELLKTIVEPQFRNEGSQADHKYGIDGTLTYWKENGRIILYFGLRRGGTSFYALDVTNINSPRLLWKKSSSDYSSMGQSWSPAYLAKITDSSGSARPAVIISGGYDADEDRDIAGQPGVLGSSTTSVTANEGNDILIFDAVSGALIWKMPDSMRSKITSSIPGGIRILDTNYNKVVDRMYFADTGGNVWRLDLRETQNDDSSLTKLAALGGGSSRKFYNEPDVSLMKLEGKTVYGVSVGSGFRAHPLDKEIQDKFFVIKDTSPFAPLPEDYSPIVPDDLAIINISGSSVSQIGSFKDPSKKGWMLNLPESGEKVLATAVTFDGIITFTTLVPEVLSQGMGIDQCAAPATQGRLYAINILTGEPGLDLNGSGEIDGSDVFMTVTKGEIPGKPQTVVNELKVEAQVDPQGNPTGEKTCTHPMDIRVGKKLSQATGYEACRLESVYWSDPVTEQ